MADSLALWSRCPFSPSPLETVARFSRFALSLHGIVSIRLSFADDSSPTRPVTDEPRRFVLCPSLNDIFSHFVICTPVRPPATAFNFPLPLVPVLSIAVLYASTITRRLLVARCHETTERRLALPDPGHRDEPVTVQRDSGAS